MPVLVHASMKMCISVRLNADVSSGLTANVRMLTVNLGSAFWTDYGLSGHQTKILEDRSCHRTPANQRFRKRFRNRVSTIWNVLSDFPKSSFGSMSSH